MTHSIYEELVSMTDADDFMLRSKINLLGIGHIFDYAFHKYQPAGTFKPIVFYCCHAYSWESKLLRIGADRLKTKLRIAQLVNLPEYLTEDVIHLKDQFLSDSFQEFLHLYRENSDFIHLASLQDAYGQIMLASTRFQDDGKGLTDLEAKLKNLKRAGELLVEIQEREEKMLARYRILDAPKNDFLNRDPGDINPLRFETSPLIR